MRTTTTATTATTAKTADPRPRPRPRSRIGLAVLGAVLVGTTACGVTGAGPAADTADSASVPTAAPATASDDPPPVAPAPPNTSTRTTTSTAAATSMPTAAETRPTAMVDQLIGAPGARVHVRCSGSGASTVLLIAGFEGSSDAWASVEPAISERTRVCSYDRSGTGTSDPATATATFATQAADLHELLATIDEPGPYVVVGHSFGGAQAVTFAAEFPDDVAGLVLVDASPVTWPQGLCDVADDGSAATTMVQGLCAGWSDPVNNAEHLDVFAAFADASAISSLGSLPMAVVTAVDRQLPAGFANGEVARLTDLWDRGQQRWVELSTGSRLVPVDDTSHNIQLDHPDVVIDEIVHLLP